eukprot:9000008-Ditylum_brightwellii.AAC.1
MTLDFSSPKKVRILMLDYIMNLLADLPEEYEGEAATPAANHLHEVNDDAEKLNEEEAQFFHHVVAKLLFLCKRARPDLQTSVAFLSTRVKAPDIDDKKKLRCTLRYLRATKGLPLTLEADDLGQLTWWVDAAFAVHHDMRSHTGGVLMAGKGAVYATSTKQKLNTRSSTEAELIGINDVLPQ